MVGQIDEHIQVLSIEQVSHNLFLVNEVQESEKYSCKEKGQLKAQHMIIESLDQYNLYTLPLREVLLLAASAAIIFPLEVIAHKNPGCHSFII